MKKLTAILFVVMVMAVVSFFETAKAGDFPTSGKYTIPGGFSGNFKVVKVDKANKTITVEIPTIADQLTKEGITNPSWKISASYCWYNGTGWILATESTDGGYMLTTSLNKDGSLLATTKPLQKGEFGWYRFWGQDTISNKWLWINQSDAHNRNDAKGNPGYEVVVNYATGKTETIPGKYDTRN